MSLLRFNSILPSAVYGFASSNNDDADGDGCCQIVLLKPRESPEEFLKFWGLEEPCPI